MSYANLDSMIKRFGESDLIEITDTEEGAYTGQINVEKLNAAMEMANSEVDGYLAKQVTVPMANPPKFIEYTACDMARYHVALGDGRVSERDEKRYENAIKTLKSISRGDIELGVPSHSSQGQTNNLPQVQNGRDTVFGGHY